MSWYRGFESIVSENVSLATMNTYKVGGPAEFFAQPSDPQTLGALLSRAANEGIPVRLLGHGTNLLVADSGMRGLVIRLHKKGFGQLIRSGTKLLVGAGHSLPALVNLTAPKGLSGLECLQGVPGTVGAALRMNAGGKYGEICSSVTRVRGFELDGTPFDFSREECGFIYRNSALHGRVVTECELSLAEGDPESSKVRLKQILSEKCSTQPVSARSAGCVFKNPKHLGLAAGRMIDELGLKGTRIGGAVVSDLHANFLVCEGNASAHDLVELIRTIRERVLIERGVVLELEVEVWGLDPAELMPKAA
ncbi:MAG TPA: UDP-N-acetylmuramate dehydrogenase [Planctomycetota bacterium]|nr:UDP-N-acetylmuramate dehydrogenase [Planctomycetota bacterium]